MDKARKLAILGMVVSGLLAILKITVGWFAHSAALSADGFESATDVFTSGLVLVGLILAARPPDQNHPYGHGRVEILIGLLLGFILACAGGAIAWHGLTGFADEKHVPASYAVWPLVVSILAKFGLVIVKSRHGRKIGSSSLVADAANDGIDMLSGFVALGALSLTLSNPTRFLRADHYGAFAVGLIVIATAARVMYESGMQLMDTMPDERSMSKIREVALSVHDVAGVEKCFARKTGFQYHVDLHLEVDPEITVRASHEIASRVRDTIRQQLPWVADVLVHVEPWLG
ncbi:MAG TPA: cation diffusion facilitator family transporter [Bryobacteraceae bacterium]|jgi:cation diffusion facilitator family transporter|nr:cation diffusion facilitator family transporter [Bryobacteraceae bacterium]